MTDVMSLYYIISSISNNKQTKTVKTNSMTANDGNFIFYFIYYVMTFCNSIFRCIYVSLQKHFVCSNGTSYYAVGSA